MPEWGGPKNMIFRLYLLHRFDFSFFLIKLKLKVALKSSQCRLESQDTMTEFLDLVSKPKIEKENSRSRLEV